MGLEVPVVCEPIYPGDRFRVGLTYQMQLAPMLNPVYDGLEVNFEAFFVPNRIIDVKWKEFWTGYNEYDQMTQTDIAPLRLEYLKLTSNVTDAEGYDNFLQGMQRPIGIGSLLDFLGVQYASYDKGFPAHVEYNEAGTTFDLNINALPILAYSRIYDDWYRNERTQRARLFRYYNYMTNTSRSLVAEFNYDETLGEWVDARANDTLGAFIPIDMFKRNYKKDRFTTALPEPVIGGDVHIPVNDNTGLTTSQLLNSTGIVVQNLDTERPAGVVAEGATASLNALALGTIEQLKLAFKEYSYRMKDTYNGNRYVESIDSHYGIRVPDSTLQRSYYLGSSRDYVNFGEVYQTSSGDGNAENGALGDYAGRGGSAGTHYLFDETFYEHGFMFVLMCVNPISRYFQGVKRFFTRFDRSDYFEPEFQNIGDDFIQLDEIYNAGQAYGQVFGFNSRWVELKTRTNELHGDFADSNPDNPLFRWNFARTFGSAPTISSELSQINPINKPFVDSDKRNDNYFVDIAVDMKALRPILAVESF